MSVRESFLYSPWGNLIYPMVDGDGWYGRIHCKGVLDLEKCMDYFALPWKSCENLNFPTHFIWEKSTNLPKNTVLKVRQLYPSNLHIIIYLPIKRSNLFFYYTRGCFLRFSNVDNFDKSIHCSCLELRKKTFSLSKASYRGFWVPTLGYWKFSVFCPYLKRSLPKFWLIITLITKQIGICE